MAPSSPTTPCQIVLSQSSTIDLVGGTLEGMNPPRQKRADSGKEERGIRDMPERVALRIVGDLHRICGKVARSDQS